MTGISPVTIHSHSGLQWPRSSTWEEKMKENNKLFCRRHPCDSLFCSLFCIFLFVLPLNLFWQWYTNQETWDVRNVYSFWIQDHFCFIKNWSHRGHALCMFTLSKCIIHVFSSLLRFLEDTIYAGCQLLTFCNIAHGQTQRSFHWNHDQVPSCSSSAHLIMTTANDRAVKGLLSLQLTPAM